MSLLDIFKKKIVKVVITAQYLHVPNNSRATYLTSESGALSKPQEPAKQNCSCRSALKERIARVPQQEEDIRLKYV